jgi:hypothetical protein
MANDKQSEPKFPEKYVVAERECQRFLDKLAALKNRFEDDEYFRRRMAITGGAETGAVKRASLDLSRVLSDLRRP